MRMSWGTTITLVYTAFAVSTLCFVGYAMTQRVDLVYPDYYEQALLHDDMQQARMNAARHGVHVSIARDTLFLEHMQYRTVSGNIEIDWYRAQDPSMDRHEEIALHGRDAIMGLYGKLARGHWDIRVRWKEQSMSFQIDTAVML